MQEPCRSCSSGKDSYNCRSLERDGSQCALTFKGNALDGSARFETLSQVSSVPDDRTGHMPVEFWRVKETVVRCLCGSTACCIRAGSGGEVLILMFSFAFSLSKIFGAFFRTASN